jgi:hypothetical protein
MSDSQPGLWWAVDQENGSFTPLPAGPLLLPAILIYGILRLFNRKGFKSRPPESKLPQRVLQSTRYKQDCARYRYLADKMFRVGLDQWEELEFNQLQCPSWNNGRPWSYKA